MDKHECETIREVIDACMIHVSAIRKIKRLKDVTEGLYISISKLKSLLSNKHDDKPLRNSIAVLANKIIDSVEQCDGSFSRLDIAEELLKLYRENRGS